MMMQNRVYLQNILNMNTLFGKCFVSPMIEQAKLKKQKSETTQIFLFLYLSEQTPLN